MPRSPLAHIIACLVAACALAPAHSQVYPSRAVRIVSPFPPGGANDIVSRVIAQKLSEAINQQVVVENRPGAAGGIGSEAVAKSLPDGHTLVMGTLATHGINASVYKKLPYDVEKDFAPITLTASIPIVLVAHPAVPVASVKELIALARERPGRLDFASSGAGSVNHLAGELFKSMARVYITHIPYRGSAPALTDTLSGQVPLMFDLIPSSLQHVRAGKVRALGVTSAQRSSLLPEVPTLSESGLSGYEVTSWFGLLAPARTPPEVIARLNVEVVRILRSPDVQERLSGQGAEPMPSTPDQFARVISSDLAKWAKLVREIGLQPE